MGLNQVSAEVHLAAILAAYSETDGHHISFELKEMLDMAGQDFDGPEEVNMSKRSVRWD